ncbi:hypothetical protein V2J09_014984 [Rumex salicifolius]
MPNSLPNAGKKRKRSSKIFSFQSFCYQDCPVISSESFRERIRVFLRECAEIEESNVGAMSVWSTILVLENKGGLFIPLYTFEETVRNSNQPYCDHCRCCGWSHHFVSRKRYHFIIPADDNWKKPLNEEVLDIQNHLLHGMVHSNGFGHLLCINGVEGGSKNLHGRELMDLWGRICTHLHTRKITLEDESKKRSMDLRLLDGVAYGHTWFGKWGYRFCTGSFGVEGQHYDRAIALLTSICLDDLVADFRENKANQDIAKIVRCYRDMSETQLTTLQELLRFMLTIKSWTPATRITIRKVEASSMVITPLKAYSTRACHQVKQCSKDKEKSLKCRKFASLVASLDSRWPTRRLEYAANVIVDALKEKRESDPFHKGMTRQEVRDAARLHIGDTGLLDYVLKSMNNVIVGDYRVCRAINPTNRILEYTIEDNPGGGSSGSSAKTDMEVIEPQISKCVVPYSSMVYPGFDVYGDIIWLYNHILLGFPETESAGLAARVILDSKHFVKEWPLKDEEDQMLRFVCKVLSTSIDLNLELNRKSGPGELVFVPLHTTIGELKEVAGKALRDTYCFTERFEVTEIVRLEGLADDEVIFGVLESGSEIWVRGIGLDWKPELRHEGGPENWIVKCECGARDDDGERMVSCDVCEIWQHTRCIGIKDSEAVPALYLCTKCCSSLAPERVEPSFEMDSCIDTYLLPMEEDFGMQLHY